MVMPIAKKSHAVFQRGFLEGKILLLLVIRYSSSFHLLLDPFQIGRDIDMLWAEWNTLTTLRAGRRTLVSTALALPLVLDHLIVVEHPVLVPDCKVPRNINTEGAGHTVLAAGAVIAYAASHAASDLFQYRSLLFTQWLIGGKGLEVLPDLFLGGHATKDDLHILVVCYPAKGKGSW